MSDPKTDDVETAREDLLVIVAAFIAAMITAGVIGAVVWNAMDKLFAMFGLAGVWGSIGIIIYAVKAKLW